MSDEEFASRTHPVSEDMSSQRRMWRFERIGWVALLILVALTLAGLFSKGPLSSVNVKTSDGKLSVAYERFSRNGATDDLVITTFGKADEMRFLLLGHELLQGVSIESLNPQPAPLRSDGADLVIPMKADGNGMAILYLTVRSNGVGLLRGRVQMMGGEELPIPKFIYP